MTPRHRRPQGFTLIEIMITLAIIAILAAIAIPGYVVFIARAQITEALAFTSVLKAANVEFHAHHGTLPADLAALDMSSWATPNTDYLSTLAVGQGAIHVTFGNKALSIIAGETLTLQPFINGGAILWRCGNAAAPAGTAQGANLTSVKGMYLPASCR